MNSPRAVSASKSNDKQCTVQQLSISHDHQVDLLAALYYVCCYFWMHSPHADCSFYYFLPYSEFTEELTAVAKELFEELVSRTSYIHSNMLLICIIDFLLQLK